MPQVNKKLPLDENKFAGVNYELTLERAKQRLNIMSDSDLAKEIEVFRQTINQAKKGRSFPWEKLVRICLKRKVSLDYVFTGVNRTQELEDKLVLLRVKYSALQETLARGRERLEEDETPEWQRRHLSNHARDPTLPD